MSTTRFLLVALVCAAATLLVVVDARRPRPSEDPSHPFYGHGIHANFLNDAVLAVVDVARLVAHGPKRVIAAQRRALAQNELY